MTGRFAKCPFDEWTPADSKAAIAEGWDLFDCEGKADIERHDDKTPFKGDDEAIDHVVRRALAGDRRAAKAIFLHGHRTDKEVFLPPSLLDGDPRKVAVWGKDLAGPDEVCQEVLPSELNRLLRARVVTHDHTKYLLADGKTWEDVDAVIGDEADEPGPAWACDDCGDVNDEQDMGTETDVDGFICPSCGSGKVKLVEDNQN
jgi:hypothetical protein